ncbi:MAG: prepilin-type N-terminal cleavage/methylation domain-containing protein, partial [Gammaproteobacteria bacterium]|nr:prepilin-type N-terminal cleavage/methylation domain-containing protein [Gammaproteobacteria bacterium]
MNKRANGFTITELMITLVILGILASFALPAYRGYVDATEQGVLRSNMQGIEIFQEDLRMRTGSYGNDLADLGEITAATGWD